MGDPCGGGQKQDGGAVQNVRKTCTSQVRAANLTVSPAPHSHLVKSCAFTTLQENVKSLSALLQEGCPRREIMA